jgi:hypothetical protein
LLFAKLSFFVDTKSKMADMAEQIEQEDVMRKMFAKYIQKSRRNDRLKRHILIYPPSKYLAAQHQLCRGL